MSARKAPAVKYEPGERVVVVGWYSGTDRPATVIEKTVGPATLVELDATGTRMLVGNHNLRRAPLE